MDIRKTAIQLFAVGALLLCQQAPAKAQQAKQPPVKLQCKGSLSLFPATYEPTVVSGVLIEMTSDTVRIYGVPVFANFQEGLALKIFSKNPATIFAQNSDKTIAASVKRYSGELNLTRYTDASQKKVSALFEATCINPNPVF